MKGVWMMSLQNRAFWIVAAACVIGSAAVSAQPQVPPQGPQVSMSIRGPAGTSQELTTHESGLASVDVNGHQYGFRPTMYDDAGTKMIVTIFDMGGPGQPVREVAAVDVSGGGPAVTSKSSPAFSIKAWKGVQQQHAGQAVPQTTRK
jgi:hypothetical protein